MATPSSNYKMSKLNKTWLAVNEPRMASDRFGQIRRAMIQADLSALAPTRSRREDSKKEDSKR